jgi:hypothetical protein
MTGMDPLRRPISRRVARACALAMATCALSLGAGHVGAPALLHARADYEGEWPPKPTPTPTAEPTPAPRPTAPPTATPQPTAVPGPSSPPAAPAPTATSVPPDPAAGSSRLGPTPAATSTAPGTVAPAEPSSSPRTPQPTLFSQLSAVPAAHTSSAQDAPGRLTPYVLGADVTAGIAVVSSAALAVLRRRGLL